MSNPNMTSKGAKPLATFNIDDTYILSVYKGSFSEFDLLLKYRQKDENTKSGWSRIRTPKHIHWAVDALIKMSLESEKTKELIDFLIKYWEQNAKPIMDEKGRDELLSSNLLKEVNDEAKSYVELADKGEYSVKFLLLIAKLLMFQEKTNNNQAYMFKNLLEALKKGKNIFKIISIATHR